MSPRLYAVIAGGLLAVVGFFALIFEVNVTTDDIITTSVECGTGFGMVDKKPIGAPADWRTLCDDATSTRQAWGWGLVGVGALVLFGGLAIKPAERDYEEPAAS